MRIIFIVILLAGLVLGFKIYSNVISEDITFGMGNLRIVKQDGSELKVKVKIADNINSRARGLMYVKDITDNDGMLFVFEKEEMRKMWMENTYIPLDMLFVNGQKRIFNFKENAVPLSRDIIYSVGPALYVVELKAGFINRHNITVGDKIDFEITK